MAPQGQHKTQLEIARAREGATTVRSRIESLAAVRSKLDILLLPEYATDEPYRIEMRAQIKAIETEIQDIFGPSYSKTFNDMQGAVKELERSMRILSHPARAKSIEEAIAEAMDVLESGIVKLEARIVALEAKEDRPAAVSTTAAPQPPPTTISSKLQNAPKDRKDIVSIRPSFIGITIDINEIWRRLKG